MPCLPVSPVGDYSILSEGALSYFETEQPADFGSQSHLFRLYQDRDVLRAGLGGESQAGNNAPIRWDVMRQRYLRLIADMAARAPLIECSSAAG